MFSSQVKFADKESVANCHLCNHPFRSLYEIKEKGEEETSFFVATTRKHQTKADRVIGGVGAVETLTRLRDASLSKALSVCLQCAAPILGARYQCREAQEIVLITTANDAHYTSGLPVIVAIVRVGRVDAPATRLN